ncbi:MAG TPA: GGDEF domain-containing response regulator [Gemmatales bacterium]|nr:GGDEF domain-containing response regulator [Gemmatales bacterium]
MSSVALQKQPMIEDVCVVLVSENSVERILLAGLLQRSTMFRCQVFEASDLDAATELTRRCRPDVILLDSIVPFGHICQEAVMSMRHLLRFQTEQAFIILAREEDQAAAVYALQEGASDYLLIDQIQHDPVALHRAIKNAVQRKQLEREFARTVELLRQRNGELEMLNQQLWKLSHTDELTGYFNRRHIVSRMEEEISRGLRYEMPLSIVLADIDHFKQINDTFGHLTGDRALQTIADLFRSKLRESDLIGRFGGEEFLLILPHTDLSGAEAFCHRLRDHVEKHPLHLGDQSITMTASFGVSTLSTEVDTSQKLLRIADRNLYKAKYLGRNRVVAECPTSDTVLLSQITDDSSNSSSDTKIMTGLKNTGTS